MASLLPRVPPGALTTAVKTVCVSSSLVMMFSGVPDAIIAPIQRRSTAGKSIVPYTMMLLDCLVGWWFSSLIGDNLGLRLRSLSIVLTVLYLGVMTVFAPSPRDSAQKVVAAAVAFATYYTVLTLTVPSKLWPDALGATNTATAIAFAASPLADIGRILKTRDASSVPFFLVTMLTVCAASWATYGA
jgi:uncharacterized membrane-anchored protein